MRPEKNSIGRERTKVYFGWWTVLVSGITIGLSSGMYFYGFSTYMKPLQDSPFSLNCEERRARD